MPKMGMGVFLLSVLVPATLFPSVSAPREWCFQGTYLSNANECELCPANTYMPLTNHSNRDCFQCTEIVNSAKETLISDCNRTNDAVIQCIGGNYRKMGSSSGDKEKCVECTECSHNDCQIEPCTPYYDTGCCPDENYDVIYGEKNVYTCRKRPWICRKEQYLSKDGLECLPCPKGTFMNVDNHNIHECIKCLDPSSLPKHAFIAQQCSRTQPDVIECEDGFSFNHSMGLNRSETGCSPCTNCSAGDKESADKSSGTSDDVVDNQSKRKGKALTGGEDGHSLHNNTSNDSASNAATNLINGDHSPATTTATDSDAGRDPTTDTPDVTNDTDKFSLPSFFYGLLTGFAPTVIFLVLVLKCRRVGRFALRKLESCHPPNTVVQENPTDEENVLPNHLNNAVSYEKKAQEVLDQLAHIKQGYHDMEMSCTNEEEELQTKREQCAKQALHQHAIPVAEIAARPELINNCIKAVGDLTVKVISDYTSEARPLNYSWQKLGGVKNLFRHGSGMLNKVMKPFSDEDGEQCVCPECKADPQNAVRRWAMFQVVTTARLVYDVVECINTVCKVELGGSTSSYLQGVSIKKKDEHQDVCVMYCITHDAEVSRVLEQRVAKWKRLREKLARQDESGNVGQDVEIAIIYHLHGLDKLVTIGRATIQQDGFFYKLKYTDMSLCRGSCGAPVCVLGSIQGFQYPLFVHSTEQRSAGNLLQRQERNAGITTSRRQNNRPVETGQSPVQQGGEKVVVRAVQGQDPVVYYDRGDIELNETTPLLAKTSNNADSTDALGVDISQRRSPTHDRERP